MRKTELSIIFSLKEEATEDSAKYLSQSLEREEIAVLTRGPFQAIERESASRNDAVKMDVVLESLAPGMKNGSEAEVAF